MYPFNEEKLGALMAGQQIDMVLVCSRHNMRYLTGYFYHFYENFTRIGVSQYMPLLGLPAKGMEDSFYVGVAGERGQMDAESLWIRNRINSARDAVSAAQQAARMVKRLGFESGRIGIEVPFMPTEAYLELQRSLPQAMIVDANPLLDELRAVKDERELALMRSVNDRAADAICAGFAEGKDGITTKAMEASVRLGMEERGLRFLWCFTGAGPGYLRAPSQTRWTTGNVLHLDAGGDEGDYLADICRMGCLGQPAQLAHDLYSACLEAQDRVRRLVKPGAVCKDLHEAGVEVINRSSFGQNGEFMAHGMGMVSHEHPVISSSNDRLLEQGMVLSIETEFRHPEVGHVKIEDAVAVTADGCEGFGDKGREWQIVS